MGPCIALIPWASSGGVYIYYWPRGSSSVPDDVRVSRQPAGPKESVFQLTGQNPNTQSTNVAGWGQPAANLSVPACRGEFGDHVIVFNIAFCGD